MNRIQQMRLQSLLKSAKSAINKLSRMYLIEDQLWVDCDAIDDLCKERTVLRITLTIGSAKNYVIQCDVSARSVTEEQYILQFTEVRSNVKFTLLLPDELISVKSLSGALTIGMSSGIDRIIREDITGHN